MKEAAMGLDLSGTGRAKGAGLLARHKGAALLERAAEHVAGRWGEDLIVPPEIEEPRSRDEPASLWLGFGGGTEGLGLDAGRDGTVEIDTRWSLYGPGYLLRCCEALRELTDVLGIRWSELETDCGDGWPTVERAQAEALRWLGALLGSMSRVVPEGEKPDGMQIMMPMDRRPLCPGEVLTPMGPRSWRWVQEGADEPARALEVFAWWAPKLDAGSLLGLARFGLWNEVRWAPGPDERDVAMRYAALRRLERAYELDPTLDYPWPEWRELQKLAASGQDRGTLPPRFTAEVGERASGPGTIGYNRHDTEHRLPGGWSIVLPGRFWADMENEQTWIAVDGEYVVRVSTVSFEADPTPGRRELAADDEEPADPAYSWETGELIAHGAVEDFEEDGRRLRAFQARCFAEGGNIAFVTITFGLEAAASEAARLARTMTPPAVEAAS